MLYVSMERQKTNSSQCRPNLQCNEAEGLSGVEESAVAVAPIRSGEGDGDKPQVGEDQVE